MVCCVQMMAVNFWGECFFMKTGCLEQRRGSVIQHTGMLYLISIIERLSRDPYGMLLRQVSTHRGMSMVRLYCRQEQWKQYPVIPPLPTLPPTGLTQETFSAIQTIAMAKIGCIVSKKWMKHPYFYTG